MRRKNPPTRAQNTFAITSAETSEKPSVPVRRLSNTGASRSRRNGNDDDGEGGDGGKDNADGMDHGSDSEENEWKIGYADSDDDSDLESDKALGESHEEWFADFTSRGYLCWEEEKGQALEGGKDLWTCRR